MQSFHDSSVPPTLHPGFTSGIDGGGGATSYPLQPLDPQSSPRIPEEYVGLPQQQHNPQAQNQHPHLMMSLQTTPIVLMQGYGSRGGGSGEALIGDTKHGGTNNPYRKEMDYYFSSGTKEGHRRPLGYGTGSGFTNLDGQVPHQFRPARSSGSALGMSRYQMDYAAVSGGSGNSSSSGGVETFSPSHQYNIAQNLPIQTAKGPQINIHHQAPNYSSHQSVHQGQRQRRYALSGHRFPPPFSQYPQNASAGVYKSPPQRYHSGRNTSGFEYKINNSSSATPNPSPSPNLNNIGQLQFENSGQSCPSSDYLYNPQSCHSHQSHPIHSQHHHQQSLGPAYDANKMHPSNLLHQPGLPYSKHHSSSKSSSSVNHSIPQFPLQEVSKSPMHSQPQQSQIHQNFSPISNPSPAASVVQSPSCSSSPSPLMNVLEGSGNAVGHSSSYSTVAKPRSGQNHNRLLQMMPQLSPTPSANSSSSGCGSSSGNINTISLSVNQGNSHSQTQVGVGTKGGVSDDHPSSPHKLILDAGTNSLNALSSQVANLPNTVQQMLLSDSVLSDKRSKDSGQQWINTSQQKNRGLSPGCSATTRRDGSKRMNSGAIKTEGETDEESSQMLGSQSESGTDGKEYVSERRTEMERSSSGMDSLSESTGSCTTSQNQIYKTEAKSEFEAKYKEFPLRNDLGSVKRQSKSQNSSSVQILFKKVDQTDDLTTPPSSLASYNSPAVKSSKILSPACPSPASFSITPSPIPSPSLNFSTKPSQKPSVLYVHHNNVPEEGEHGQLSNKRQHEVEKNNKAAVEKEKSDASQRGEKNQDKKGKQIKKTMKEQNQIEQSYKEKVSDEEKQKRGEHSDNVNKKDNMEETHSSGSVGVIVTTCSESTRSEEQLINSGRCSSFLRGDAESHPSCVDSSKHNGDSRGNASTNISPDGAKVSSKPISECWLSSHHPHSKIQKSSFGYSEIPHVKKNTERPMLTEGAIETDLRYQDHNPPHYSHEVQKRTGIEGQSRRGLMSEAGVSHEPNTQLQQPFPSLLQEVLQGYHTDKRYGHNEMQQFQTSNAHPYSHYRHHQSMMEHSRTHVMATHTRLSMDYITQSQTASERLYNHNEKQDSEVCMGQDPSLHSWGNDGVGVKGTQWSTSHKNKMVTSPCHLVSRIQQSSEVQQHSKHINLSGYSLPPERPFVNHPPLSSAVQQLLLQETNETGHNTVEAGRHENTSLSERCSVIHDTSPSNFSTSEREQAGDKEREQKNCEPQTGCPGASVIQQSSSVMDKGSINKQGVKREMKQEEKHKNIKKGLDLEIPHFSHCPAKENASENCNIAPESLNTDNSKEGKYNSTKLTQYRLQQHLQHSTSSTNPLSSPSSSAFHSYFECSDESNHSTRTSGFVSEQGTNKLQHSHQLSQHHLASISQNQQSSIRLQMYPNSHSVLYSHDLDSWAASNKNLKFSKDIMYSGSGQQLKPSEDTSQTGMLANQQQIPQVSPRGRYYDKMWGMSSEKDHEKILEEENDQKGQQVFSVTHSESVAPTLTASSDPKQFELNTARPVSENTGKSCHPLSNGGNNTVGSTNNGNVGAHSKIRTGTSPDTNPLMMRRRVRSFISPIPPKRQHQDVFQQQQHRVAPIQRANIVSATGSGENGAESSNISAAYSLPIVKMHSTTSSQIDSSVSSSSSLAKTKILPPRKSRGLKLEAIVQKITPNLKKPVNITSGSNGDSSSNHHSGISHTAVAPYSPETQDYDSIGRGNLGRAEAESSNCLPFLSEGLLLDDIMSYKGVEDTGPPPPTAYPCDPHQDLHILAHKREMMGNTSVGVVKDLEPDIDFGLGMTGASKLERDYPGETKDDLRLPPDFALLGPLPPPPPLPCPVQASPPPSSSSLSDIQNFTTTYQQLETRRSENTAATLLRQKLQESGIGLSMDNYSARDFLSPKSPHYNRSLSHCLLTNPPHTQLAHYQQQSSAGTIMTGSLLVEPKLENAVPKGYFPSGKKKGRPVGSVNKQKRIQIQPQNLLLNVAPDSQKSGPSPPTTISVEIQTTNTTTPVPEDSPQSIKLPPVSVSPTGTSKTGKDVEIEDIKPEIDRKPRRQRRRKKEDRSGEKAELRQRRRELAGMSSKDDNKGEIETGQICNSRGFFSSYRNSVFVPYIHVERKQEMGNVCTIVNGEDEMKKAESGLEDKGGKLAENEVGGGATTSLNSTLISPLVKKNGKKVKEKNTSENVEAGLIQSSQTGKALPSYRYVLSGPVTNDSNTSDRLLCCLCKKWANYKDLGDLYGPYYPPDYSTRLSRNAQVAKPSQGTVKLSNTGVNVGSVAFESTEQKSPVTEVQTHMSSVVNSKGDTATNPPLGITVSDSMSLVDGLNIQPDRNYKEKTKASWDLMSETDNTDTDLKPLGELNKLEQQLQCQQPQTGDMQKRPQHRKLTSHQRFKRRHKSSEDLPRTVPVNSKALLPFQPPPPLQLLTEGICDPSTVLALLPQVPLDPEELWVHEGCIVWASEVYLVNGRLYGLQEALDGAREMRCSYCQVAGSTLGCYSKGCTLRYHYVCAMEADCYLNEDNFSLQCPKHKFSQNSKIAKAVHSDQSGRG